MCPNLGTVLGDVKRHIAHNFNSTRVGIALQLAPLTEELILRKLPKQHLVLMGGKKGMERFLIAYAILLFPSGKSTPTVCLLDCHKCGKISKHAFFQKRLECRRLTVEARKGELQQRNAAIEQCLIVNTPDLLSRSSAGIFLCFLFCQQALRDQRFNIN